MADGMNPKRIRRHSGDVMTGNIQSLGARMKQGGPDNPSPTEVMGLGARMKQTGNGAPNSIEGLGTRMKQGQS